MRLMQQISPGVSASWLCAATHAYIYMHISLDSNSRRGKTVGATTMKTKTNTPRSILAKKKKRRKKKTPKNSRHPSLESTTKMWSRLDIWLDVKCQLFSFHPPLWERRRTLMQKCRNALQGRSSLIFSKITKNLMFFHLGLNRTE